MLNGSEYKLFQLLENFIQDIYGCSFLQTPLNPKIGQISEIAKAHITIRNITNNLRFPYSEEFINDIFPILEVALQWDHLKKERKRMPIFLEKCRKRMGPPSSNFRGTIFEIDIALRCLLSEWIIDFPEDYTKAEKQIDLIIKKKNNEIIALECTQKRGSDEININDINNIIEEKSEKFKTEYMKFLERYYNINIKYKIIIIDITRRGYKIPFEILNNLEKIIICENIDGIFLTWREDKVYSKKAHSLYIKYKSVGNLPDRYFTTTWCAEFRVRESGTVFFLRKYIEPEPAHGEWGPEESLSNKNNSKHYID